jgi:hypothetical protein
MSNTPYIFLLFQDEVYAYWVVQRTLTRREILNNAAIIASMVLSR